jgi:hypothetical protein
MTILKANARFKVVACGRRFGKTELAKLTLLETALRGGGQAWWLAPTYTMALQVWRDLKTTTQNISGTTISESEHRLTFPSGGSITIRSAHAPDNLRGAGLDFAVLDEAAFMAREVWSEVVRPMLLDRKGSALFLSTPNGMNWFWELYQLGLDPFEPEWASFHFPSAANPLIPTEEFAAIQRVTPERIWRQEYLAEFVEDSGAVFRGIREAASAPMNAMYDPTHVYIAGCDWGKDFDYSCLVVIDATTRKMVAMDRFNQIGWTLQRGRVRAMYDRWRPSLIWAESNSIGSVNIEALQAEGLPVRPFTTTSHSKMTLIEGLALAIERSDLALLPDPVLLNELAAYSVERLPGGGYRYSAPPGLHDDTVIATGLAWHGAKLGGSTVDWA